MLKEKLKKFFSNQELSGELLECQTSEDVKRLFAENGIDINDEENKILKEYIDKFIENEGQLSEKELDRISGGGKFAERGAWASSRIFKEALLELAQLPAKGWSRDAVKNGSNKNDNETKSP